MGLLSQTQQQYYDGNDYGGYQFVSLTDIIDQFMLVYVGEDKIIPKAKKIDVAFHAQRALAELSFDTLKSHKAQEIILPSNLQMILPQDYVNYTRLLWVDGAGIKHPIYPTKHTQNPTNSPLQNTDGEFKLEAVGTFTSGDEDVVLDGDYDNIIDGMRLKFDDWYFNEKIVNVNTSSGITTITMQHPWPTTAPSGIRKMQFISQEYGGESHSAGSPLIPKTKKTVRLEGVTITGNDKHMTAASASDAAQVEVGMFVIHDDINEISDPHGDGPKVIDIQGSTIYVSNGFAASLTVTGVQQVNFISYEEDSETWKNYKSATPSENDNDDYKDDTYWPADGNRYGLEPSHAQVNGSFFIDDLRGLIHFSSNLSGKTIVLDYISDSLGTDGEMIVHKLAEEAMYKSIAYAVASGKMNIPEYIIQRLKKERFAATRTAKLRLSNLKLEELTQILRGKSKWIKH